MYSFPFSIIIRELDLADSGRRIKSLKDAIDRLRIKQQRLLVWIFLQTCHQC